MVKADIALRICTEIPVSKSMALNGVDAIMDAIKNALAEGRRVEIRGFGVFEIRSKKLGTGRDIRTGKTVPIPTGKSVRFKPGLLMRDLGTGKAQRGK